MIHPSSLLQAQADLPSGIAGSNATPPKTGRAFGINPGPGSAWTLSLVEYGLPAGGGQFPEDQHDYALEYGQSWYDVQSAEAPEPDTALACRSCAR